MVAMAVSRRTGRLGGGPHGGAVRGRRRGGLWEGSAGGVVPGDGVDCYPSIGYAFTRRRNLGTRRPI